MSRQFQFPEDGGAEEAVEVAAAGEPEAGNQLLGHGCSADDVAAFEDGDGEAGACQVGGGDQAVMAAADDQRVPFLRREVACGGGGADSGAEGSSSPHDSRRVCDVGECGCEVT